jgi:hypothetical protein
MFNNTKINRYELHGGMKDKVDVLNDFNQIDNFKDSIKKYIYTDIILTNRSELIEKAFQSRLQILQSETLLRALMLKEGMVVALNNNNFPSYYAALKSFLEIPAVLGYVTDLIYNNKDYEKIILDINRLHMGNREAGSFPTGNVKAINILTLFEKLDRVFKDIGCSEKTKEECEKIKAGENILTSIYADICNFGHTNFNANMCIGILHSNSTWEAKKDLTGYKKELWSFYMVGFLIGMDIISMLCATISRNEKVDGFNLMNSPHYFND